MNAAEIEELKTQFRRCRAGTVEAIVQFRESGDTDALHKAVIGIVERYVPPEAPTPIDKAEPATRLIEDLGIDSLAMLEMVMSLEEALHIKIENEELRAIRTLEDVKIFLVHKRNNPQPSPTPPPSSTP